MNIREADLLSLDHKLELVSEERKREMREQGAWIFQTYFSSNKKIIETMLEELNDRVFTFRARTYVEWNTINPHTFQNPLFLSRVAQKSQGFTAVILTYDRVESLFKLIEKLSIVPSLQKILVVWNNEKEMPPHRKFNHSLLSNETHYFTSLYSVAVPENKQTVESDSIKSKQTVEPFLSVRRNRN